MKLTDAITAIEGSFLGMSWFAVSGALRSVDRFHRSFGDFADNGAPIMHVELLKECITTLQQVRDAEHSALDISVVVELDLVIAQLQQAVCEAVDDEAKLGSLAQRALKLIGRVAETAVVEIIKAWLSRP